MIKYNKIRNIILPNKRINIFTICIMVFGIITGSIFANTINLNDKNMVIEKIKLFIDNVNSNNINSLLTLKNSLGINSLYIAIIFILGMTLLGIIFSIILLYIKGFIFGFTVSSFIICYGIKGIVISFLYLLFGQVFNIIGIVLITIYAITFSKYLFRLIFKNDSNIKIKKILKNYFLILLLCIILLVIASLLEAFLLPALIKIIIRLYISL